MHACTQRATGLSSEPPTAVSSRSSQCHPGPVPPPLPCSQGACLTQPETVALLTRPAFLGGAQHGGLNKTAGRRAHFTAVGGGEGGPVALLSSRGIARRTTPCWNHCLDEPVSNAHPVHACSPPAQGFAPPRRQLAHLQPLQTSCYRPLQLVPQRLSSTAACPPTAGPCQASALQLGRCDLCSAASWQVRLAKRGIPHPHSSWPTAHTSCHQFF